MVSNENGQPMWVVGFYTDLYCKMNEMMEQL